MNKSKFIPIISLLFSGIVIYIFMQFFYYEEINGFYSLTVPVLIFAPILLGGFNGVSILKINLSALAGFLLGFTIYGIIDNINIWPIAMLFWALLSLPSIAGLNIISIAIKRLKCS